MSDAKRIIEAPKQLVNVHAWVERQYGGQGQSTFEARVEIDGAMPRGLWFRIVLFSKYRDIATFQLECEMLESRSHLPLYRLDWHPLNTHMNGQHGPLELRGLFFDAGVTHEHICLDHAIEHEDRIRSGGVQTARGVEPDFGSFDDALGYVCDKLKLQNCEEIPTPNVQWLLL